MRGRERSRGRWPRRSGDHAACQAVGEAVAWLGFEGMIVPSARASGANVIYTANLKPEALFDVGERQQVEE